MNYLYQLLGTDLSQFTGENPEQFFEVIRGQAGGLCVLPEPCAFQEDLAVLLIRPGYFHPETGERVLMGMPLGDDLPPEIEYIPQGGAHSVTARPALQWFADLDQQAYDARAQARLIDLANKQAALESVAYVLARSRDYASELDKTPIPGQSPMQAQIQAIGHTLDELLGWVESHFPANERSAGVNSILQKRQAVKERNPKP